MRRMAHSPIALMALVVGIDFAGFGLVIPILPFWAERMGATSVGVGLILTAYALAQFLCTPLIGALSDRYGRRPVIFASLLIEALSFALTAVASVLPFLLLARIIGGLGASNIGSAQAVIADVTAPDRRARGMGAIGAAIGVGFVIGPALGGLLATLNPSAPFWLATLVALANAILVWRFLPETRRFNGGVGALKQKGSLTEGWSYARRSPIIVRLVAVNLLVTLAFAGMETVFPLFTQQRFHWEARQNGFLFTYIGVVVVIMQGGLVGRLVKRWGEHALLIAGLLLLALGLALIPVSAMLAPLLLAVGILSIGDGAVSPTSSALLSLASPDDAQGATLGLSQGVAGLGRAVGPIAAGALFAAGVGIPFVFGAALVFVAAALAIFPLTLLRRPNEALRSGKPSSSARNNARLHRAGTVSSAHHRSQ